MVPRLGWTRPGAAFVLLAWTAPPAGAGDAKILELSSAPLVLLADQPGAARVGALAWRGGLDLRSTEKRFGAISALLVSPDGSRAMAVTDKGDWLDFPLRYGANDHLIGVGAGRIGHLHDQSGARLEGKIDADAESLARLPDDTLLVAFERNHRLLRYPAAPEPLAGKPELFKDLTGLKGLKKKGNKGVEALTELDGGALLSIVEGQETDRESPAFLWRNGEWADLRYLHPIGFRPTGAALLPNGDVLVLERFYKKDRGVRIRLVRVLGTAVRPNARLSGEVLATLAPPMKIENLEGIATRLGPKGETLIYLISDNDRDRGRRTLLLHFALRD